MDRFWSKVNKGEDCWEWTGSISDGYGKITINNRQYRAHRVSWELSNGPVPKDLIVRHKCDNRKCVNPDHLELGTIADNNKDTLLRGRHKQKTATHCKRGHKFEPGSFNITKQGGRDCKACKSIRYNLSKSLKD